MPRTPRQMHGRRVLAAAAAAGLLISLFAPWYRETVVAPGVTGLRTLTLTRSGWQAFSGTELLILIVALLTVLIVIGMRADDPTDEMPDHLRLSARSSRRWVRSRSPSCWCDSRRHRARPNTRSMRRWSRSAGESSWRSPAAPRWRPPDCACSGLSGRPPADPGQSGRRELTARRGPSVRHSANAHRSPSACRPTGPGHPGAPTDRGGTSRPAVGWTSLTDARGLNDACE